MLYLTQEHALARDTLSAVFVADPTPNGILGSLECNNRFVSVTGTLRRHSSGDLALEDVTTIEYWKPVSGRASPWDDILPAQCWPLAPAA